jgi:hypothetical protein
MEQLRAYRVDVSSAEHLDRYEQLFELQLTSVIFGMGERQSFLFFSFMTVQDFSVMRCTCFFSGRGPPQYFGRTGCEQHFMAPTAGGSSGQMPV